jgi:hypothetical protein
MRLFNQGILTAIGLAFGLGLTGCGSFDPTDWFNNKKPLPGERKLVFPEGVPGVPQGVPAELVRGNQPAADPAAVAAAETNPPAEAKPAPAVKPKPKVATRPKVRAEPKEVVAPAPPPSEQTPTQVTVQPAKPQPAAQAARPATQPPAQQSATDSSIWGPPPKQPTSGAAPWPAPAATQQRAPAPWPEAPPAGTFSR